MATIVAIETVKIFRGTLQNILQCEERYGEYSKGGSRKMTREQEHYIKSSNRY